ncbi:MAG: 30S ribosomal protein S6--L-glutamate ligase [Pantoea sp. Brub]|nr:30S ribosomal protein S6--L-glutamate ligase [Pantoea sp. Brub]
MNIAILSRDESIYSCSRLKEEAEYRGHLIKVINPLLCNIKIQLNNQSIKYCGKPLKYFDAVIPRIGTNMNFHGITILRHFEMNGTYSINKSSSIINARNKVYSLQLLSNGGIDIPNTVFSSSWDIDTKQLISLVGGTPLIIKLTEGSQGIGVIIAETNRSAESVIDTLRHLNINFLVQEFIKEANGKDIRCLVINKQVVSAIERQSKKGNFRSNLHRGGKARSIILTEQEKQIAKQSASIIDVDVAGIDIIRAKRGPLVMEINISPGLEGIEAVSGLNIASLIIKSIENNINIKK